VTSVCVFLREVTKKLRLLFLPPRRCNFFNRSGRSECNDFCAALQVKCSFVALVACVAVHFFACGADFLNLVKSRGRLIKGLH